MEQNLSPDTALWRLLFQIVDSLRESALDQQRPHEIELAMNLTLRQQQLLRNICVLTEEKPEDVSLKELAASLSLTSGAASAMVEGLVRRELLERRTDEADRRAVQIRLSENGLRLIRELEQQFNCMTHHFLAGETDEEIARLIELLDRFNRKLQTNEGEKIS